MRFIIVFCIGISLGFMPKKYESLALRPMDLDTTGCPIENKAFRPGEKLVFKVYYKWTTVAVNAGELAMSLKESELYGKKMYHAVALGQTHKSYEWFYKVRDRYESYIEPKTMQPLKFVRDVNEGGYITKEDYYFYPNSKTVQLNKFSSNPPRIERHHTPGCVNDVLSAIYYARNVNFNNLNIDDKVNLPVFIDSKTYQTYIRYKGREVIKTKLGRFNAIKIVASMIDNDIFEGGEDLIVWVSDDDNRLPLRIESPLAVGAIKADLKSYSGIKFAMNSKID